MEVTIAKNAGFCFGVKRAVDLALKNSNSKVIYTYGTIIHNSYVVDKLKNNNIFPIEDLNQLKKGDTLIIRSHGVGKEVFNILKQKQVNIIDATCPYVKKIHNIVMEKHKEGYQIIIFGEKNHPEVKGINGWCDNSAIILDDFQTDILDFSKKYCAVFQTTFPVEKFKKIEKNKSKQLKLVEFFNTICYTTIARQEEINCLSKKAECVLVIGDKKSSNTTKLYNIAKNNNSNTFFIDNLIDLRSICKNMNTKKLVITAGASTPYELIKEVVATMSETQAVDLKDLQNEKEEVNKEATLQDVTMDDVMNSVMTEYKAGKRVKASVLETKEDGICLNIGGKKDGFIDKEEVSIDHTYNPSDYKPGDIIEAMIIKNSSNDNSCVTLSKREVDLLKVTEEKVKKIIEGEEFSVTVNSAVKGGLLGKIGNYTVFIPASQIRIGYVKDLTKYVGKKLRLVVLPAKEGDDKKSKRNAKLIKASQRLILEKEKAEREESFWSSMVVGEKVTGKVKRFAAFGAFVNVKGFDCLAHISDLSWNKIENPSDVLQLNETYEFLVLKVDRENDRVSLGYKQLQKKPYELAAENYEVGSVIKGKVERIFPFGAFVSIDEGVDGLVHVSQISHEWIKDANDALKVGQEVEAKIISFEDNKITLSMKELLPEPVQKESARSVEEEAVNSPIKRTVKKNPRAQKMNFDISFNNRKDRKPKKEQPSVEWKSDNGFTTLGELFKDLKLDLPEGEDKE